MLLSVLLLLVLLLVLLLLLLLLLLVLLLVLLLLEGACIVLLLLTNRARIRGVTYPREIFFFFLSLSHKDTCTLFFVQRHTHSFSHKSLRLEHSWTWVQFEEKNNNSITYHCELQRDVCHVAICHHCKARLAVVIIVVASRRSAAIVANYHVVGRHVTGQCSRRPSDVTVNIRLMSWSTSVRCRNQMSIGLSSNFYRTSILLTSDFHRTSIQHLFEFRPTAILFNWHSSPFPLMSIIVHLFGFVRPRSIWRSSSSVCSIP